MKLLITGGAGFIGSNFVRRCLDGTFDGISSVVVLDSLTYAGVLKSISDLKGNPRFNFIHGDIRDMELVSSLISSTDAILNFAAESHVDRSINNSFEFVSTNVLGVQNLLEAVRRSSRNIRFLQISTDEVYGSILKGSWTEESPLLPNSPYAASKAAGELIVRSYTRTYGMDIITTRCSNNYGPNQFPEKLIPLIITNLIDRKKIPIYGNGLNVRDWLHVGDHCEGIFRALMNGKSGEIYNIGGGLELNNLQVAQSIMEIFNADETFLEFVEDRQGHDFRYSIDDSKIRLELGYKPKINFNEGILSTIEWYKKNESWWRRLK